MDFLDIRKKAKERAQARAAEEAAAAKPRAAPATGREASDAGDATGARRRNPEGAAAAPPGAPAAPVVTDEDVIEGALAARLQGLPPAGEPPAPAAPPEPEADGRFMTWRPGVEAPPPLPPEEPAPASGPEPHDDDFTVVAPASRREDRAAARAARSEPPPEPEGDPLDEFFYREDEAAPALPHLAPAARATEERPRPLVREEYLTFLLGAEEYAVAIERVREVIRAPPITEVPRAPAHVLGVVTVRGEVVAVLDPRRRLGLEPASPVEGHGKVVIVDAGDGPCGLLVDRVASVVRLLPGSIEPCPQGVAGAHAEILAGIGRAGDRLFTVLELGALLRRGGPRADGGRARRADAGA